VHCISCVPGPDDVTGFSLIPSLPDLGAPNRVFYKSEDKMKIHSPNAHRKSAALKSDYFYNYFLIGMVSTMCYIMFSFKFNSNKLLLVLTAVLWIRIRLDNSDPEFLAGRIPIRNNCSESGLFDTKPEYFFVNFCVEVDQFVFAYIKVVSS
jgi:hypothetical protein